MAPENNWLSFSLSPMDHMLNASSSQHQSQMLPSSTMKLAPLDISSSDSQHYYFLDNFYANGWANQRAQGVYTEGENQVREMSGQSMGDSSLFSSFVESQIHQHPPPKLEDFLGGDNTSSFVKYSDSQTETQDSSLTHIYDHGGGSVYFNNDSHDFKAVAAAGGFQAFSTNSGSEVDDSASVARTTTTAQLTACGEFAGQSIESAAGGNELELVFPQCPPGALSLAVVSTHSTHEKAIVSVVDSDSCKKITDTFGQRTSIYRGVTRHRWTGRYEAHLWDNSCRREGQARKGRQVYLGGYDKEDKAARAYDLAALKYWGPTATTNFPVSSYTKELEEMKHATKQEFIASLRRKSSGFSRGASIYRGVTRHHQQGRWQARIGRVAGNKDLYLGTFATEEEAAEAYDIAAIKFRGLNAVTNFEMNRYDVEAIAQSALPIGGAAKRLKLSLEADQKPSLAPQYSQPPHCNSNKSSSNISFSPIQPVSAIPYGVPFDNTTVPTFYHNSLFQHLHSNNVGAGNHHPSPASSVGTSMTLLPSQAEYYIYPHQSY